jgi:hypothetical protein
MWKKSLVLAPVLFICYHSIAQQPYSLTVNPIDEYDNVKVALNATDGHCHIAPGSNSNPVHIDNSANTRIEERINGRTKEIDIKLSETTETAFGSVISKKLFSTQEVGDQGWKVYLSAAKPMDLNLAYAVGDTHLDLSGLPIERLKLKTGSSNVFVNYKSGKGNSITMDTMLINVDMGSFETKNLHLSNSQNILADVGFGSVLLDFEDAASVSTNVEASVGAGKLEILLPSIQIPVKININNSPLCRVKIPANFTRISDHEFVNTTAQSPSGYINFNVDVAVGHVIFR